MSWRGSTGHIDANVPDYQKMLQGRYSSSGWSSTPPAFSSYNRSVASHGGYLTPRSNTSTYSRPGSHRDYTATYQPSKYGLTSDSSYNTTLESNFKTLESESATYRSENGYDSSYGFISKEFDLGPYRSSNRGTDYSSDSGHAHMAARKTDYSSDSGMSFAHHRRKSNEFELDIPSPETAHSRSRSQKDEIFSSPVKSQRPVSDYIRFSDKHKQYASDGEGPDYRHDGQIDSSSKKHGRSVKNNDHGQSDDGNSPRYHEPRNLISQTGDNHSSINNDDDDEEDLRANFLSPTLYQGNIGETTLVHRQHKSPNGRMNDLTHWQQNQKQHNTSINSSQPSSRHALHHHRSQETLRDLSHDNRSHNHDLGYSRGQDVHDPSTSPRQRPSEEINQFRSAADAIIRDKDAIIEELRGQVINLELSLKEYENKLRRSLMSRSSNGNDDSATFSKMQDLEYRNAELRTELAKLRLQKDAEVEDLEIKLGGVEHEIDQLKTALRKAQPNAADMKEKLMQKDGEIEEWKKKYTALNKNFDGLREKLAGMERYLSDLPTIEEFNSKAEELASCKEDSELKREQLEDLEYRLNETTQLLSDRETTIQELEGKQQQLAGKMRELTTEIKRIKSGGEGKALSETQERLAETEEIKDRVTKDLEKAKKLLEVNHRRLRQIEVKHQTEVRQLQERLSQEEESVMALREEVRLKEEQVAKLKKSLKEFASKNQDLMDESLQFREQLKQYEQMSTDENQKLQRRFVKEMSLCFSQLQSLVQICVQKAEGKDPNVSLLLWMRDGSAPDDFDEGGANGGSRREENSLKHWFTKLKELRAEVEKVRDMICNKFAEDMGDNLNCATQ